MQESGVENTVILSFEELAKTDTFGWSCLHYAADLQLHNTRIFFSKKYEILNHRDLMGWTPLHHACLKGNEKVVDLLLGHDDPIEVAGYDGITPIHCAVQSGNANILKKLIENVKSERQKHTRESIAHVDRNERHPIHWAAVKRHVSLVRMLKDEIGRTIVSVGHVFISRQFMDIEIFSTTLLGIVAQI